MRQISMGWLNLHHVSPKLGQEQASDRPTPGRKCPDPYALLTDRAALYQAGYGGPVERNGGARSLSGDLGFPATTPASKLLALRRRYPSAARTAPVHSPVLAGRWTTGRSVEKSRVFDGCECALGPGNPAAGVGTCGCASAKSVV